MQTRLNNRTLLCAAFIISFLLTGYQVKAQAWQWTRHAGGTGDDGSYAVTTDAYGHVYTAGFFSSDNITFGSTTLTRAGASASYVDMFVAKYDTLGNVLWARSAGGDASDLAQAVATDAAGNVYVTGVFASDSITFGSVTLHNAAPGTYELFLVKYDSTGTVVWAKGASSTGQQFATGVATDASGNCYITGYFSSDTISFGPFSLTNSPGGSYEIFVTAYDPAGNVLWAHSYGGTADEYAFSITTDHTGNILVGGTFYSPTLVIDTITLSNASFVSGDVLLIKLDPTGGALWAKGAGGNSGDQALAVATDESDNIYITGDFSSPSILFGSTMLTNSGFDNMFLAKYTPAGSLAWATAPTSSSQVRGLGVAAAHNSVYVAGGYATASISFGGVTLHNDSVGLADIFLAQYNTAGVAISAVGAGGNYVDEAESIATNPSGGVYLAGYYGSARAAFGTDTLVCGGSADMFLARYSGVVSTEAVGSYIIPDDALRVYPNPATTQLCFQYQQPGEGTIQLRDITGRLIATHPTDNTTTTTIDISNLVPGMYLYTFTTEGNTQTGKVVVMH